MNGAKCIVALILCSAAHAAPIRVDISPDNGRKDVLAADWENWLIKDGLILSDQPAARLARIG